MTENVPGVKVTSEPLTDYSISDAPGTILTYFGYEFEVPWNARFTPKTFGERGLVQLQFESGQNVTFISPTNQNRLLTEITQDRSIHMENLQPTVFRAGERLTHDHTGVSAALEGGAGCDVADHQSHRSSSEPRNRRVLF